MNLTAGSTLQNGKYILNTVLEQAGFGVTYQATCTRSEQPAVIQTLSEELQKQPEFASIKQRFLEEANQLTKCQHSNLVKAIEVFEESGNPFLVTNQVSGRTLAETVQANGALAEPQALHAIRQIGAALRVLHQHHLLHRNIKPKNLVQCDRSGFVVLTNFGIAQGESFSNSPPQGHLSAGYAALEQYYPKVGLTPATDVYGLAATFYFLLTGKTPTAAPMRDRQPMPNLRQLKPDINPAVEQAILQGMATEAHLRPQSIEAWLALLPNPFANPDTNGSNKGSSNGSNNGLNGAKQTSVSTFITSLPLNSLETTSSSTVVVAPNGTSAKPVVGNSSTAAVTIAPATPQISTTRFTDRWWRTLKITSTIAIVFGIGFGLTVRLSGGRSPGSTLFNTEQNFPPSDNWPGNRVADPLPEPDLQNSLTPQPEPDPEPIYQAPEPAPLPPQPSQSPKPIEPVEPEESIAEEVSPAPSPTAPANTDPASQVAPPVAPPDVVDPAPAPVDPVQPSPAPPPAQNSQPPAAPTNSN